MDISQLINDSSAYLVALLWQLVAENSPWFYLLAFALTFFEGETLILVAGLWAASFVAIGYFLGHAFRAVLGDLARSFSLAMLGAFVAIGAGMWLLHRLQRRRQLPRVPPGADVVLPPP